jgi:multidrug resistance efflux pump
VLTRTLQFARTHSAKILLAASVLAAVVLFATRPERPKVVRPERAWTVEVRAVKKATLRPALELFGQVESNQDAVLSAAVEGEVLTVSVREGETVAEGDTLIRLDDRDAVLVLRQREAELGDIRAQHALSKRRLVRTQETLERQRELTGIANDNNERARQIFADGIISQSDLDVASENLKRQQLAFTQQELAIEESELRIVQLEAQVARAIALRDQAALVLERTHIKAPFAGVVADVRISAGDRVRPGDSVMQIYNPVAQEVRAQVPSRYLESLRAGLDTELSIPAKIDFAGGAAAGSLARISGQARAGAGGVDAFFAIGAGHPALRLGTTVRIVVELPPQDAVVALPAEALYGQNRAFKMIDGRMQPVFVERVGERTFADGRSEIIVRSVELNDGDQLIVTKLSNAAKDIPVVVYESQASALAGEARPGAVQTSEDAGGN